MKSEAWNYSVWKSLNDKLYSESLNQDDLLDNGSVQFFESIWMIDDDRNLVEHPIEPVNYRDVVLVHKNDRYIVPVEFAEMMPFKPVKVFECQIKKSDKRKYYFVTEIKSLNINGDEGGMTFKQFLNDWNDLAHSEPYHWLFLKMIAIASVHKGIKLCLCSEPSSGKNSNYTVMNHITRDVCRIQKPTLAKFETVLYFNKVVLPDEITSLEATKVRDIEPAILWIGDNSTEYNKHSMAKNRKMNNVDLMQKSLIFTYNRREDLTEDKPFFDEVWSNIGAFKSRFPQLLVKGVVKEEMKTLNFKEAKIVMEENFDDVRKMAKAFIHFTTNLNKYMTEYEIPEAYTKLNNRHKANLQGLVDVMMAYSDTQEEFDSWVNFLMERIKDYKQMAQNKPLLEGKPMTAADAVKFDEDIL